MPGSVATALECRVRGRVGSGTGYRMVNASAGRMWAVVLGTALSAGVAWAGAFTSGEREAIRRYWSEPSRYTVSAPPGADEHGVWQVRLSPEASLWIWNYNQALGLGKTPPAGRVAPISPERSAWDAWIDARIARDRWVCRAEAAVKNALLGFPLRVDPEFEPFDPGPPPSGLAEFAGAPPPFAVLAIPAQHTITFEDGFELSYSDNVEMRPRYAYYRFEQGVMSVGVPVRNMLAQELDSLFGEAGVSPSEQRVMKAVSLLEGGFDSVNTYDTGFVSVGFIQFACLKEGGGSLGTVLAREKTSSKDAFQRDFRVFGLDVTDEGLLVALNLRTGEEQVGPAAAAAIISDKRLIAVFQRAGLRSREFRLAQVRVARDSYLPTSDPVTLVLGERQIVCKVSDIVQSEAGLATLMDRKVNTGKIDILAEVASDILETNRLTKPDELRRFERDLVMAIRFRKDYLADASLVQPGPAADPKRNYSPASRRGARGGRGGG